MVFLMRSHRPIRVLAHHVFRIPDGFLESMRREWRWRVERGESTRNLEAFRHLLEES